MQKTHYQINPISKRCSVSNMICGEMVEKTPFIYLKHTKSLNNCS